MIELFFFSSVKVYAILSATGLMERSDVCDVSAAETSHDGSQFKLHSLTLK